MADSKGLAAPSLAAFLAVALCFAVLLLVGAPSAALADDYCKAVALTQVPPDGETDPAAIATDSLKPGDIDEAISGYSVDKKTGRGVFSAHGGDAHPRFLMRGGQRVEALRLTNCRIGAKSSETRDEVDYDVVFESFAQFRDRYEGHAIYYRLEALGLCPPCAGTAVDFYLKHPGSRCAVLTGKALAGNRNALAVLQDPPGYCNEQAPGQAVAEASQKPMQAPKSLWYVIDEGGPTHDRCAPIATFAIQMGVALSPAQAASNLAPKDGSIGQGEGSPAGWWEGFLGGEEAVFANGRTIDFAYGLKGCQFMNSPGFRRDLHGTCGATEGIGRSPVRAVTQGATRPIGQTGDYE